MLRTAGVTRDFGGVHAVAGVSIEVRRGTLTGLIGPNGAGKSTLLAMLAGTIPVTSGQVIYAGADVTGVPAYRRARLGLVRTTSSRRSPSGKTWRWAVTCWAAARWARGSSAWSACSRGSARCSPGGRAGRLSGGERKMLAMGRVLMVEPAVFLLDEPTANLAPQVAAELLTGHVRALAEADAAVLVVEQRARAVLAISDYTYVLGGGQVLMADTPARLSASREFTESFFGTAPSRKG